VVAAERGLRTLVASADVRHSLGDVLDVRLGPEPRRLAPGLFGLEIDPRVESARHWGRIQHFLERTFRHQGHRGGGRRRARDAARARRSSRRCSRSKISRPEGTSTCSCSTARPPTPRCAW
jgi:hypothetical protein